VQPDYDLKSNTSDVYVLRDNIDKFLLTARPLYVIVYGDTNSTLADALAAKKCKQL
jgi:UDP-N-acetylglucosamine 2-epimerase